MIKVLQLESMKKNGKEYNERKVSSLYIRGDVSIKTKQDLDNKNELRINEENRKSNEI